MSELTHAEWSALTDAANRGTDEPLIEAAERIIADREAAAEKSGAERALLEAELEIRDAVTIPIATRASICAVLRGHARRATGATP